MLILVVDICGIIMSNAIVYCVILYQITAEHNCSALYLSFQYEEELPPELRCSSRDKEANESDD